MTNQAITRRVFTQTLTFTNKPNEETRKALVAAGFQFDSKSRQWLKRDEAAEVQAEEVIAQQVAA